MDSKWREKQIKHARERFKDFVADFNDYGDIQTLDHVEDKWVKMPYFEMYYPEDNIACAYWQKGKYFYRQYEGDEKPKRISEKEYIQTYEQHYNL